MTVMAYTYLVESAIESAERLRADAPLGADMTVVVKFPYNREFSRAVFEAAAAELAEEHNIEVDWSEWPPIYEFTVSRDGGGWMVYLPTQGDNLMISGDYLKERPHVKAVEDLEAFIMQAQEALAALYAQKEYGNG